MNTATAPTPAAPATSATPATSAIPATSGTPATANEASSSAVSVPKWGIPISRKAYVRFVRRIRDVYADDPVRASHIERSLELYLCRDTDYTLFLADPADKRGFEFLRQEVDIAIERSAKARERARKRKDELTVATSPSPAVSAPVIVPPAVAPVPVAVPPAAGPSPVVVPAVAGHSPVLAYDYQPEPLSSKIENGEYVIYDPACEGASPDEIVELRIDPATFRGTPVKGEMSRSERRAKEREIKKHILAAVRRDKNVHMGNRRIKPD